MDSASPTFHHLIAWGSDEADAPLSRTENDEFLERLKGHSFLPLMPGVAVLIVSYSGESGEVNDALRETATGLHPRLSVVMSPAMPATPTGTYSGLLGPGKFDLLRKRLGQPPKNTP